jgi:hypothetical protein
MRAGISRLTCSMANPVISSASDDPLYGKLNRSGPAFYPPLPCAGRSTEKGLDMDTAAEESWTAAKAKANFWQWFTIDLIVMCFVTYVFDLSPVWLSFFVVVPLLMRKRVIAYMMAPR